MKTLKVATCLMYVTLFALVLYTRYDTQKFIKNLPQPPVMQREGDPGENTQELEIGTPYTKAA